MKLKVFFIFIISFCIFVIICFYNLGYYLDITQKPQKSDIIVCLGGELPNRINYALKLYEKGYSNKNILILTGQEINIKTKIDLRIQKINSKNYKINYIHNKKPKSTEDEINFIKRYMKKNNLNSAIIISDPPHSKRIITLIEYIIGEKKYNFNLVSIETSWWDKKNYYKEKRAFKFAINELLKLTYTNLVFGIFYKIGLINFTEKTE